MSHRATGASGINKSMTTKSKKAHPTFHFLAGLTSGVSSAVLLQPADLLKTRVQQSHSSSLASVLRNILSSPNPISSLWRGTVPSALRTGFGSALYFTSLNSLRQVLANRNNTFPSIPTGAGSSSVLPKLSSTQNLVTGATARVFAGFVLMPVTVIKVRYESDIYQYRSIAAAARSIFLHEGVRGFFSGFGATAVRDAPYAGLYVVFYEASKVRLNRMMVMSLGTDGQGKEISAGPLSMSASATVNATSGVMAAGLATAVTNPFDAVKTRLQLMPKKYGNMVKATSLMLREDGIRSFLDGLGLRMARKALSSALAWTVYEELIGRAERLIARRDEDGRAVV